MPATCQGQVFSPHLHNASHPPSALPCRTAATTADVSYRKHRRATDLVYHHRPRAHCHRRIKSWRHGLPWSQAVRICIPQPSFAPDGPLWPPSWLAATSSSTSLPQSSSMTTPSLVSTSPPAYHHGCLRFGSHHCCEHATVTARPPRWPKWAPDLTCFLLGHLPRLPAPPLTRFGHRQ
jgi:hypothetical protein